VQKIKDKRKTYIQEQLKLPFGHGWCGFTTSADLLLVRICNPHPLSSGFAILKITLKKIVNKLVLSKV